MASGPTLRNRSSSSDVRYTVLSPHENCTYVLHFVAQLILTGKRNVMIRVSYRWWSGNLLYLIFLVRLLQPQFFMAPGGGDSNLTVAATAKDIFARPPIRGLMLQSHPLASRNTVTFLCSLFLFSKDDLAQRRNMRHSVYSTTASQTLPQLLIGSHKDLYWQFLPSPGT